MDKQKDGNIEKSAVSCRYFVWWGGGGGEKLQLENFPLWNISLNMYFEMMLGMKFIVCFGTEQIFLT